MAFESLGKAVLELTGNLAPLSASLKAGTSMSESIPNRSRTFATLSGEGISVSARLSGCTLERSVILIAP